MYLIGGQPVGCIYRINAEQDEFKNLNSPGMTFANMCEIPKENTTEIKYEMFISSTVEMIAGAVMSHGNIHGWWGFCKRGMNWGLVYLGEEEPIL